MAINTLEYAKIFQTVLDEQMEAEATSGWMESNAGQVKYSGGNEVKIPKMTTSGMADYDRDDGYVQGSVSLSYETKTMTQDRGRTFQLDAMDVDEANFIANASSVMGEFQRLHVIPEVDAYRYSRIAALAAAGSKQTAGYTPAATDILSKLKTDILKLQDAVGDGYQFIITMSMLAANELDNASGITKMLDIVNFKQGTLETKVKALDGNPIVKVPSGRLKTAYVFNNGTTAGQEAGGFTVDAAAKQVNWIISIRKAPIAVSKTDTMRIFDPMTNQKANAWRLDYRKYHDLWIQDNALAGGVWVNIGA